MGYLAPPITDGIAQPQCIARTVQHLGVAEHDLPRFPWLDWKYSRADQPVAFQRKESRVPKPSHDLFVHPPSLLRPHHFSTNLLFPHPEGEIGKHRFTGHGVEIGT